MQVVPPATGNNAVITVKVGGNRTSLTAVGNLAGVTLGFYAASTGGTALFTCTSDADGDCSIIVPNTQAGGANRDARYWVRQTGTASGYYTNPSLGTGTTVASDPYTFQTGAQLRNGNTYSSTVNFMVDTGSTNNEASGGIWQNSLTNPTFPAKCGINVGLVLDLSNSLTASDLTNLKAASNTFIDALTGTPSQVGTFTFATAAPAAGSTNTTLPLTSVSTAASATTVKNKINGLVLPGGADGGTNWDRGLYQVAQSTSTFDVAVVITDGNPTYYGGPPAEGPGGRTRFREVENGIFSANAIKAEGTKVIAFGVGGGVDNAGSGLNLRSISGTTLGTDYYQTTDYAAAGAQLRALALGSCTGSVTVVKQVVPAGGSGTTGATPQGGWTFTGTGSTGITVNAPTARVTATGTGAANFPLTFAGGTTSGPVTFNETQQTDYTLVQVGGLNAVCTRVDTGAAVTVTNSGATGFTVTAASAYPVSCVVYNRAPQPLASVILHKQWVVNGTTLAEGQQPAGLIATGTLNAANAPWEQEEGGFRQADVVTVSEATDLSGLPLCTLNSARLTNQNGTTVNLALPSSQTLAAGVNNYTITNTVTCDTRLKLTKSVEGGSAAPADWTLTASRSTGLAGPSGTTGVNASVTPALTYTLSESNSHPEYAQFVNPNAVLIPGSSGSWNCQEVRSDGVTVIPGFSDGLNGGVTVPFGRYVSCNARNQTSTLTLSKVVQNTHGGTAMPGNWQLTATPTGTFPVGLPAQTVTGSTAGVSFNVRPGVSYALTESGTPPGYSLDSVSCQLASGGQGTTPISVPALDTATCTFTNVDTPAHLTLLKQVVNDNGGTATPGQWTLTATGPTSISGATGSAAVTNAAVNAGTYTLGETGPTGYAPGSWACTGGTVTGATVTVTTGANVTCTIVNNDQPGQLTLVKTVTNDNGGTATAGQWTLTATGPTTISGATGTGPVTNAQVNAGTYVLSESGPTGYAAGAWACVGGTLTGSSVTVANGAAVTCTINNNDQPAHLTLVKTVTNDNGGTATVGQWTLTATGPTTITGVTGAAAVTNAQVNAGTYTLSESGGPAGYAAGSWSCTAGTLTGASLVLPLNTSATCTINNNDQPAHLTLVKTVTNDNGGTATVGQWTLTATGPTTITGVTGAAAVTNAQVNAGTYTLSESGPAGYAAGSWSCDAGTLTGASLVLPLNTSATCTINNNDQPAHLTLVKTVTNDNGGTATVGQWTLTATGPTTISGASGTGPVTNAQVNAGTYVLSESGPAGYAAGAWSCTAGTLTGTSLVLPLNTSATCTINNNDQPAHLTLVKTVTNDNGGTATVGQWTLTATGPTTISGASGTGPVTNATVNAGTYALSESGPAGYAAGSWSCDAGTLTGASLVLPNGVSATCTIHNDDQPAHLTLVKTVTNDSGGTAVDTDWTLTATGPTTITGATGTGAVTNAPVNAGTYVLSESGPGGYAAGAWSCTAGTLTGASLVLPNGVSTTCTINNNDQPAHLTLVKTVTNDNGGTATVGQWTLTATGPTTISGASGTGAVTNAPVNAGTYVLSESGPAGYAAGSWLCDAGTLTGSSLLLPNGVSATCTIHNDDQPAHLTLVKTVTNDNGGTAVDTDWTLTATGPTTITGVVRDPSVTNATVNSGTYVLSESGPGGYAAGPWSCDAGTLTGASLVLPNGVSATCTIHNDDQPATLTLVKTVTNDNGGTAADTDWALTATGPTTITGVVRDPSVTNATVNAGTYVLSESGPAGYAAGSWSCDAGTLTGASLVLPNGVSATCTINNNDQPAHLTLVKTVTNDNGGTAAITDWTLTADGPTTITGATGTASVTNAQVDAGSYDLSEAGPAGYTASAWTCTGSGVTGGSPVTVPNGGNVTCTIHNDDQPAHLTLVKTVTNDNGGTAVDTDWTLTADGPTTITGATGTGAVTNAQVDAGTYALSESGPAGYTGSAWTCTAGTLTDASLVLPLGTSATCTIHNDDQPAHLTLVKTVTNDNGGTAVATDWTLTATGPTTTITGATGTGSVTNAQVDAGSYDLSEAGPAGYTASAWTCTGSGVTGGSPVTIPNGGNVSCTIVNDDQPAHLTLVKTVTNDSGGTAADTDWTLTATGPTSISGATGTGAVTDAQVDAGTYALSESGPAGYTASGWTCTAGTLTGASLVLPNGVSATCTIHNDDQPATLTLVKTVTNDNGGTAADTDWTLTATGPTTISGATGTGAVTDAQVDAGTYALSESGPAGYTASGWTCTAGTLTGASLVLPNGVSATCTIHNDDQPATLTLVKTVINDNEGTATPEQWTLTADGPTPITGPGNSASVTNQTVHAGQYTLSESGGPDGYTAGDWSCTGSGVTGGSPVTLPNGGNITCTIVNNDEAGTFDVVKGSDPASGSTVEPGDVITYTVTATKTGGVDPSVVVVDDLSEVLDNATLVPGSITTSAGTADITGDELTWTVSALSGEATVSYQVRVNDGAYGVRLTNVVTSEGSETCPPPGALLRPLLGKFLLALQDPAEDCSTTHVTPRWALDKTSNPASGSTVDLGSTIVYSLGVTNVSEAVVSNATVTDDLSQVLAHGSLQGVPAGATLSGNTLTWVVPTLQPGESTTLTYSVRLNTDAVDVTVGNVATPGAGGVCDPGCTTTHNTPPNGTAPEPGLPNTGTSAGWLLRVGLVLIMMGAVAVLVVRRKGQTRR